MGKSPGKWIKSVLFRKKPLKSNSPEIREIPKSAFEKPLSSPIEEPVSSLAVAESFTFEGPTVNNSNDIQTLESNQELTLPSSNIDLPYDSDKIQAVTKAQATFRGYLARRAFRTLKGIIRLQAVMRGHLVRRQAVATLYSVHGIVKFQAIFRGNKIRNGVKEKQIIAKKDGSVYKSVNMDMFSRQEKLVKNAFIRQLLSSSPNVKPLCFVYDERDLNSAWNWLNRWSISRVWKPKKTKQKIGQKKNNPRKAFNQSVKLDSEQPQNGIDKVKKNSIADVEKKEVKDKIRKRRVSLPAKREDQETRVRSYMAATESAKAKVRGLTKFDQDLTEKKGLIRRHSLPSSINGNVGLSPRVPVTGKGNFSTSRDSNDKVNQIEWKR